MAAAFSSSPGFTSPFGRNHAPSSFFAQKGPPRCTNKNSISPFLRRNKRSPALTLEDFGIGPVDGDEATAYRIFSIQTERMAQGSEREAERRHMEKKVWRSSPDRTAARSAA